MANLERDSTKQWLRSALRGRARWVLALLSLMCVLGLVRGVHGGVRAQTPGHSLRDYLDQRGLHIDPERVVWLASDPSWLGVRPAIFLAHRTGELHDLYYADVRVAGRAVLDVYLLTNVTRTSSADEEQLVAAPPFVAYATRVGNDYDALVVLDTRGEAASMTSHWPAYARAQNAITNLQDTGRLRAFGVQRYALTSSAARLTLGESRGKLVATLGDDRIVLDPTRNSPSSEDAGSALRREDTQKGQPGLITWVVDTVRRVPWIGRGPIEWLEHAVFGLQDRANRAYHEVVVTDTAAEAKEALAAKAPAPEEVPPAAAAVAPPREIGWPPAALTPVLPDRVEGEGRWLPIAADPFVSDVPGAPPLFYQTFIRVDPERTFTRVYVTLWDPRQVQLGMVMGTKEPESATGETGGGMIPRDPYVLSHVVAAFNGGFQALHGEFGAMADRRVYLPPKPYAATVAVFEDGRVGMGSWPGPGRHAWDEEFATSQIPPDMIALRQNLTSVVEGTTYNPWQRWWWGAAPQWAEEQTFIHRSGLCLTSEGFLAYLWGGSMGPEQLGQAMLATRCVRGLHLDMNDKHTGFELYRSFAPGTDVPALGRALAATEYEGPISDAKGFRFRVRLALTTMTPVRFPRYINRDPRDFFYLVRKPLLPGAPLRLGEESLPFVVDDLPNTTFPSALARARLPLDAGTVVRLDVTQAVPSPFAAAALTRPLAHLARATDAAEIASPAPHTALYARYRHGRLRVFVGDPPARVQVLARGPRITPETTATTALGVDADGFLVYVEAASSVALLSALHGAAVTDAVALTKTRLVLAGPEQLTNASGVPVQGIDPSADLELTFLAETRPAAEVLFPEVKPLPYRVWGWQQDQRVRYFPSGPARFQAPEAVQ